MYYYIFLRVLTSVNCYRVLVHWFKDSTWDSSVDYLFLRNNMPNDGKLSTKVSFTTELLHSMLSNPKWHWTLERYKVRLEVAHIAVSAVGLILARRSS